MIILGLDPGTAITGFAVVRTEGRTPTVLDVGVIRTPARLAPMQRLLMLAEDLEQIISRYKPEVIAVEKLFFENNQRTAISVAEARGVLLLAAARSGATLVEPTPLQVKQAVTGYGKADKKQVQEMVKKIFGLSAVPKPDDAADALALAYAAMT